MSLGAHLSDFVQKQRATVRDLEPSRFGADGAGERTALEPEELAFEKPFRECAAVDGDERAVSARAPLVDRFRDELLPGAAFAAEERRRGGARDLAGHFVDLGDRLALANDLSVLILHRQALAQGSVLLG